MAVFLWRASARRRVAPLGSFYRDVDVIDEPVQGLLHDGYDQIRRIDEFFESLADGQGYESMNKAPDGQAYQCRVALGQVAFLHAFGDRRLEAVDGRIAVFPFAAGLRDLFHRFAENEHQVVIFGVLHAELNVVLAHFIQAEQRVLDGRKAAIELHHLLEALVMKAGEDLILVLEIKVYGRWAVFDNVGDPADRDIFETFFHE